MLRIEKMRVQPPPLGLWSARFAGGKSMTTLEERTLIDTLIEEQRLLSAVTRFAQRHENHELPQQARYYRDLIPLSAPEDGQQYAFEVDLDQCSGCKACVTACHNLNGLDDDETWRSVGRRDGWSRARAWRLLGNLSKMGPQYRREKRNLTFRSAFADTPPHENDFGICFYPLHRIAFR